MSNNKTFISGLFFLFLFLQVSAVQAIPDIQSWKTKNGVRVLFVESPSLPMLDLRIVFDAGSARDGAMSGLASLTNGLLVEGSAGLSAQEIAERFESVGAKIDVDSLRDMAMVGMRSLTDERYLSVALDALKKTLSRPDFTQRAFERDLAHMKVGVQSGKQSPSTIADKAFYKAIYGDHPYATPIGGTDASLAKVNREDVVAFYKKYYVARNANIVIVGAVSKARAKQIADAVVSDIPIGDKPAPIPAVLALKQAETIYIDFPSKQSHIFVGQPGIKRRDKDYFTLYVANHPLGGSGFASRLVGKIREDHALAYSVYSYFSPMREQGPFTLGMQTRTDQTDKAITLLRSELEDYVENGPDEEELRSSISNIVGSYPLNLDSNSKLLGYLAMIGFYDLPKTYLQDFVSNIKSVGVKEIQKAMKRRIHTDKMITVVVGKKIDGRFLMVVGSNSQLRIIAGQWRGRKIDFLDQDDLRPTPDRVRETVFNWLQPEVPGAICLDLFAGSGALGFEAMSRGAKQVIMVDSSKQACKLIQKNIDVLTTRFEPQLQSIEVVISDAVAFLEKNALRYDVVFLDPPYQSLLLPQICGLLEQKQCLAEHAKIYLEHDVKQSLPELPENWHISKSKSAGQVSYSLVDRVET